jgi:hypothetical protein
MQPVPNFQPTASSGLLKDSQLRIMQLESDIKLKEMKLSLQSLQALNRLSDYQEQLVTLQ